MSVGTSLLTQIPIPNNPKPNQAVLPSIKVGEVECDNQKVNLKTELTFWQKIRNKLVNYRMNKIANKTPEQRTINEQAEYEANKKIISCII